MGVPVFFRWLTRKYPKVIQPAICEAGFLLSDIDRSQWPKHLLQEGANNGDISTDVEIEVIDTSQANPNGIEFDNLYLDMNGLIHPCCHPESGVTPSSEDEMIRNIFNCIDHVFCMVRPRKVIYLAVDGVAPRAKMNQQRARRFSAAREAKIKVEADRIVREECIREGRPVPPPLKPHWDSNVITPGTPFMEKVMGGLRYYINERLTYDPGWKGIKVVLSTSGVPGEGEHKLMEYIRKERSSPGYDPNTRHCIYGLDADLIMLSLASHEVNFSIIREVVFKNESCTRCGAHGHTAANCPTSEAVLSGLVENAELEKVIKPPTRKEFQFLHTFIMREYLGQYFGEMKLPFHYDFERVIDDYVFICYFVGNDFLPHLPTLDINEGAIDRLMEIYRDILPKLGGYITENGNINITRALSLLRRLSYLEDGILRRRRAREKERILRERARKEAQKKQSDGNDDDKKDKECSDLPPTKKSKTNDEKDDNNAISSSSSNNNINSINTNSTNNINNINTNNTNDELKSTEQIMKDKQDALAREMGLINKIVIDEESTDAIRLGEDGWRDRYYKVKFSIPEGDTSQKSEDFQRHLCESYMQGLVWVLKYYYQGCPSWEWYYPYHYSPFACDLVRYVNPQTFRSDMPLGEPFRPFDQLMAVLPAASSGCLPESLGKLMRDPASPIHDFYPDRFEIDLNGKKYAHQGVVILPFIDQHRLIEAIDSHMEGFTVDEQRRNMRIGPTLLYVRDDHPLASQILDMERTFDARAEKKADDGYNYDTLKKFAVKIDSNLTSGMNGSIFPCEERFRHVSGTPYDAPSKKIRPIPVSKAVCATFLYPEYGPGFVFPSVLLKGARIPKNVLMKGEVYNPRGNHISQNNAELRSINSITSYDSGNYRRGPTTRYEFKVRSNEAELKDERNSRNKYYSGRDGDRDHSKDDDRYSHRDHSHRRDDDRYSHRDHSHRRDDDRYSHRDHGRKRDDDRYSHRDSHRDHYSHRSGDSRHRDDGGYNRNGYGNNNGNNNGNGYYNSNMSSFGYQQQQQQQQQQNYNQYGSNGGYYNQQQQQQQGYGQRVNGYYPPQPSYNQGSVPFPMQILRMPQQQQQNQPMPPPPPPPQPLPYPLPPQQQQQMNSMPPATAIATQSIQPQQNTKKLPSWLTGNK